MLIGVDGTRVSLRILLVLLLVVLLLLLVRKVRLLARRVLVHG